MKGSKSSKDQRGCGEARCRRAVSRSLFDRYASAVAYVATVDKDNNQAIGSAFHIGQGVFITARHVLEGRNITTIATTTGRLVDDPKGNTRIAG